MQLKDDETPDEAPSVPETNQKEAQIDLVLQALAQIVKSKAWIDGLRF